MPRAISLRTDFDAATLRLVVPFHAHGNPHRLHTTSSGQQSLSDVRAIDIFYSAKIYVLRNDSYDGRHKVLIDGWAYSAR